LKAFEMTVALVYPRIPMPSASLDSLGDVALVVDEQGSRMSQIQVPLLM
jgi:hypothetical protein